MSENSPGLTFESLVDWREDFMQAAVASSRRAPRWRRRFAIWGIALALAGTGGIAVAELSDSDPAPLESGGTVGYVDLATGEPITCPDGEPLTYSARLPATDADATCADGSVPSVFRRQEQALEDWLLSHPAGTPLGDAPTFSYAIPEEE